MYQEYIIYWIHSDQETNIETQGYVGITKNLTRQQNGGYFSIWR